MLLVKLYNDECWGDYMDEDMSKNKLYKENEKQVVKKPYNPSPVIPLSGDEFHQWSKPWKNCLIVKALGKKVNFKLLEYRLHKYWVQHDTIQVTNFADDFFLVRLSSVDDYKHALFKGLWKIADHYLIVQLGDISSRSVPPSRTKSSFG